MKKLILSLILLLAGCGESPGDVSVINNNDLGGDPVEDSLCEKCKDATGNLDIECLEALDCLEEDFETF